MRGAPSSPPASLSPEEGFLPLEVPGRHGVRLEQFQMLNWGTFDGAVARLDVNGSNALLTGNVGAGKSTIVDGLTTVFASAHKVTYNRAAGADRSERTLATYVLGQYSNVYDEATGGTRPQSLRERKNAYSVLLARFNGLRGATGTISAGVVLWFDATGVVHRMYFTAPARLDIAEHLAGHGTTRAVRAALRAAGGEPFDDNFRNYQRSLCRYLGVSTAALDLLVQTVSMKSVGNLTDFVRAHMLDAVDASERIGKVLNHYRDLTRAHELVQTARRQLDALEPVVEATAAYNRALARTQASTEAAAAVPARVEQHRVSLLSSAITELVGQMPAREATATAKRGELTGQETRRTQLAIALQAGGGAELTEARLRVEAAETRLGVVRRAHVELVALAAQADLPAPERTDDHPHFLSAVNDVAARLEADERDLRARDFEAQSRLAGAREDLRSLRDELAAAGSRDSNVPLDDARLRGRIAEALGLTADTLPFAAELIAVAPESAEWEPAAERLVRPFALSLLVSEEHYHQVATWVDGEHLGRRLVYFRVPAVVAAPTAPRAGTMAAHLLVRPGTAVSAWLRAEVNRRFDHACVHDAAEMSGHTRAVSRAGQVKDNARHEKDDRRRADDRRHFVLGWDTAARRAHLTAAIPGAVRDVERAERAQDVVGKERRGNGDRQYAVRQITERFTDPAAVDVTSAVRAATAARELHDTLAARPDIAGLLAEQSDCEQRIETLAGQLSQLDRDLGATTARLDQHRLDHAAAVQALAATPEPELSEEAAEALAEALRQAGDSPATAARCDAWGRQVTDALRARAESASATRERAGRNLTSAMKDFAHMWPQMVTDIPSDPDSRGEYLALRERLATDDLPSYEQRFRDQLETNAIHELVGFSNFLEREAGKITVRIDTINGALAEIDYRPGTYIRLEVERSTDVEVREFRRQLRDVTANTVLDDDDTYAESRFLMVKELLDRFQGREGTASADERWTARVTDVRNWFSFAASERTREEDASLEHYTDSGGKSGGQKEKLAYTVLAASLSYQYGLAGGNIAAFRFVMIDEAFGRGSDESTRFGLELFTRLGLQLLVVTPLQKINTIAPFVDAVGYVRNDEPRSRLVTMTITEYHEQRARRAGQRLAARAVTLLPAADADEDGAVDGSTGTDDDVAATGGASVSPARSTGWASATTVRAALRLRWDRGDVLRDLHTDPADRRAFPLRVRLPGPSRSELAGRFAEATTWARALRDAAARDAWTLEVRAVRAGGLGTQQLPYAGVVDTPEQALRLLGRDATADAARFAAALQAADALDPSARTLALARPHDVLAAGEDWRLLLALAAWVRAHPRPGIHLRQIPVGGVHTKVLERNVALLSRLLDALLPADAVDSSARGFAARYGFVEPARRARVRGPAAVLGVPGGGTADVEWDVTALAGLDPSRWGINELLVLENKTSFLTAPVSPQRLVLWGAGYGVDELLAGLPWRSQVAVRYWGDIDTHGYAILSRVRTVAPHTTSVLMDTATLLAHRPYWSTESAPRTDPLTHLTSVEAETFTALCAGTHGCGVRLEQEFVRFDLVTAALTS